MANFQMKASNMIQQAVGHWQFMRGLGYPKWPRIKFPVKRVITIVKGRWWMTVGVRRQWGFEACIYRGASGALQWYVRALRVETYGVLRAASADFGV